MNNDEYLQSDEYIVSENNDIDEFSTHNMTSDDFLNADINNKEIKFEGPDDTYNLVKMLRETGVLQNKIILKFVKRTKKRVFFVILDYISHYPLMYPLTHQGWEEWTVSCPSDASFGVNNDVEISDKYIYISEYRASNHKYLYKEIITPNMKTFDILSRCPELYESCTQQVYNDIIDKYFHGEENLDDFTSSIKRCINNVYIHSIKEYENELERNRQILDDLTTKVKNHEKQVDDIRKMYSYSTSQLIEVQNAGYAMQLHDNTLIERVQASLYFQYNASLIYSDDVVRRFITALFTNQLILFSGPSGTGKSSIVRQIGNVFYPAKVHNIEVQPNWGDAMDLQGFYNPIKNEYVTTPFLEALVAAKFDENTLHIICLDEMNLAHVEYYFASLLSAREQDNEINLYADKYRKLAMTKLEALFGKEVDYITHEDISAKEMSDHSELFAMLDLCKVHTPKFKIPPNVRFVGTLNMDETVKNISPKVIDRSFIIELPYIDNENEILSKFEKTEHRGTISIDIKTINQFTFANPQLTQEQLNDLEILMDISDILSKIPNARLNRRGKKHASQYMHCFKELTGSYDTSLVIDDLICSKILPRIHFDPSDKKANDAYNEFLNAINKYSRAYEKAEIMGINKRLVEFWK